MKKAVFLTFGLILINSNIKICSQIYLDPNAKADDRVADLLPRMTLNEKLEYIGGENNMFIRGFSMLGIPEIKMSDGPVGVRTRGQTTAYPAGNVHPQTLILI